MAKLTRSQYSCCDMDPWVLITPEGGKRGGKEEGKGGGRKEWEWEASDEKYYEPRIIINPIPCI